VNAAALMHVKKTYDALGLAFPEDTIKGLNLGQARHLVSAWRAAQQDEAQGNGGDAKIVMRDYLSAMGWLDSDQAAQPKAQDAPAQPQTLAECRTVADVLVWAGDDLQRVQEAYDAETSTDKPRSSLVDTLVRKGAKVPTSVQPEPSKAAPPEPAPQQRPVEQPAEQAVATVQQSMNGQVIGEEITEQSLCVECGKPVDDVDIAKLSDARYHKVLCVDDYIAETKKIAAG
jgi:hypothetical protein